LANGTRRFGQLASVPRRHRKPTWSAAPTSNRTGWPPSPLLRHSTTAGFGQLNGRMSVVYPGDAVSSYKSNSALAVPEDRLLATVARSGRVASGACVLVALAAAAARLARRGRSRMTTAVLVTGAAAVGLAVIGVLASRY